MKNSSKHSCKAKSGRKVYAEDTIALTRIQKLISRRMLESEANKPCFNVELKADVTELMGLRPELRKTLGIKITTNTFYICALALAAYRYPLVLGSFAGDRIEIADSVNVGFAVDAPHGLIVPVVKNANEKSLAQIARQEKKLTEKARDNKLTLDDIGGETIALSNLGAYGVDSFVAIVPPSVSAILAVGNIVPDVRVQNNNLLTCKMVSLSLSVDHRVINGAYAAEFLNFLKEQLQNPRGLV